MKHKKISLVLTLLLIFSLTPNVFGAENTSKTPPSIHGSAAITLDMETGEIIYAKDIDGASYKKSTGAKGMYPASITKLMTALIFAENKDKLGLDTLKYNKSALEQPKYSLNTDYPSLGLKIGSSMSSEDVMHALLLYSANDMAYVVAGNVGKTSSQDENSKEAVDNFIAMMNKQAAKLHMKSTHFVTANGLHSPDHYTTPYDFSLLGRAVLKNNWVASSINTKDSVLNINNKNLPIKNSNKLLGESLNGAVCIGGKTGYTSNAGRCLIALFDKNGHKIIGVVMNSIYDAKDSFVFDDMNKIIDWSYNAKRVKYLKKDTLIKTEVIKYKPLKFFGPEKSLKVPLILKEDANYFDNEVNKKETKTNIDKTNLSLSNLSKDKTVAKLIVHEREYSKSYDLYTNISKSEIYKDNILLYLGVIGVILLIGIFIIFIISSIGNLKRRKKSSKYWH